MNLRTTYLGLELPHPFVVGSSPLASTLEGARRLEDAGAAAIVIASLFEEQIRREANPVEPSGDTVVEGAIPELYLENLRRLKESLGIPVIGSLNGSTLSGWINWAAAIQEMGADGLELNLYDVPADDRFSSEHVERVAIEIVREVRAAVRIPLAVKLMPNYSSLSWFARQLEEAGADAIVIFNRAFEAEVDVEQLRINSKMRLSTRDELQSRLRWAAILSGQLRRARVAVTGGVHEGTDAVKAILCGASAVQVVSVLYERGTAHLRAMRAGFESWMERHGFESLEELRARLSILTPDGDRGYSRRDYMRMLHDWRPEA